MTVSELGFWIEALTGYLERLNKEVEKWKP